MLGNDTNIFITDHAVERYIERYATNLLSVLDRKEQRKLAEEAIKAVFCEAYYLSDNDESILFRNKKLWIDLLIKNRRLITLYPSRRRKQQQKNKWQKTQTDTAK